MKLDIFFDLMMEEIDTATLKLNSRKVFSYLDKQKGKSI